MNLRFIINTVIIVLILHFILENIDLRIDIGTAEQFVNKLNANDSLKFLTENTLEGFDPRQDIIDYINNKSNDVRGDGFYTTDYNNAHFNSNVTDVQSFYNINADPNDCTHFGFDGINFENVKKAKCQDKSAPSGFKELASRQVATPNQAPAPTASNQDSKDSLESYMNLGSEFQNVPPAYQPEQWHYKGESPMNGGVQEGVVGYTKIEDDFAPFQNSSTFLEPNSYQKCTGKTADLRFDRQNYVG